MQREHFLESEVNLLIKENKEIKSRLSSLEQKLEFAKNDNTPNECHEKEKTAEKSSKGTILVIVGGILCLTVIGIIIGLPLLILGVVLLVKENKDSLTKEKHVAKTENSHTKNEHISSHEVKTQKNTHTSIEENIGLKWFSKIGILALVIGIAFFIKYAIDNNWMSYLVRIIIGCLIGASLVFFGDFLSKKEKYSAWAKTLIGGGFALTYFSIFAAYNFPEYRAAIGISQIVDIFMLIVIVIFAVIFSIKDNSQVIAAESFFLGYVTSLLGTSFELITLFYSLILTIGLVFVVSYKKWPAIGIGGIIASYALYILWDTKNPDSFAFTTVILITYFLAFSSQYFLISKQDETKVLAVIGAIINSFFFFILYQGFISDKYYAYRGLVPVGLAVFYIISYFYSKKSKMFHLPQTNLYLSLFFLTIAIPIQLDERLITISWALESVILILLHYKTGLRELKFVSYAVSLITLIKSLFYNNDFVHFDAIAGIFSVRLISSLITVLCFYFIYEEVKKKNLHGTEYIIGNLYSWAASLILLKIIFLEVNNTAAITAILSLLALLLVIASKKESKELLYQGYAVSAIVVLKVVLVDSWALKKVFFLESKLFAFTSAIAAIYLIYLLLRKKEEKMPEIIYSYAGIFLSFLLALTELKEFQVSIGWSILALIVMVTGFYCKEEHFRIQGIIIFALTILKVFLYDIRSLDTLYRTLSYIFLGVMLLTVSFIYAKYKDKLKKII
ncbi:MAG: DUF2339 domain-containing protein [archaeon]